MTNYLKLLQYLNWLHIVSYLTLVGRFWYCIITYKYYLFIKIQLLDLISNHSLSEKNWTKLILGYVKYLEIQILRFGHFKTATTHSGVLKTIKIWISYGWFIRFNKKKKMLIERKIKYEDIDIAVWYNNINDIFIYSTLSRVYASFWYLVSIYPPPPHWFPSIFLSFIGLSIPSFQLLLDLFCHLLPAGIDCSLPSFAFPPLLSYFSPDWT